MQQLYWVPCSIAFCLLSQVLLKFQLLVWIESLISQLIVLMFFCVKNTTIISIYLIKPLWAAISAHGNQEKLNGILPKWCRHIYCSNSTVKMPLLKSFGNISDLISNDTEMHINDSRQEMKECHSAGGWQSIANLSLVSTGLLYPYKERGSYLLSFETNVNLFVTSILTAVMRIYGWAYSSHPLQWCNL